MKMFSLLPADYFIRDQYNGDAVCYKFTNLQSRWDVESARVSHKSQDKWKIV